MNEFDCANDSLQVTLYQMTQQLEKEISELEKLIKQGAPSEADGQNPLEGELHQLFDNFQTAYSDVQNRLSLLAILMRQKQELEVEQSSVNEEKTDSMGNPAVILRPDKKHHNKEHKPGDSDSRHPLLMIAYQEKHNKSLSSNTQTVAKYQATPQLSPELGDEYVTPVAKEVAEGTQPSYWTEPKLKTQEREKDQKSTAAPVRQETNSSSRSKRDPSELQIGWPDKTDKQPRERQARLLSEIFTDFIYSKIRLIILLRNCIRWRQSPLQSKQWQFLICLLLGLFLGAGATVFLFYGVPDAIIMGMSRSWATYFPVLVLGMFILFLGSSALSKRLRSIFFYVVTLTWSALIGWHLVTQSLITSPEFDFIATQLSNSLALINWIIAVGCIGFAAQFLTFKKLRPVVLTYSYGFLLAAVITLGLVYVSPTRFI